MQGEKKGFVQIEIPVVMYIEGSLARGYATINTSTKLSLSSQRALLHGKNLLEIRQIQAKRTTSQVL